MKPGLKEKVAKAEETKVEKAKMAKQTKEEKAAEDKGRMVPKI